MRQQLQVPPLRSSRPEAIYLETLFFKVHHFASGFLISIYMNRDDRVDLKYRNVLYSPFIFSVKQNIYRDKRVTIIKRYISNPKVDINETDSCCEAIGIADIFGRT